MEIEQAQLPGIGLRHVLVTRGGKRVGVVAHRNGRHDLVVYRRDDPDTVAVSVVLTGEEADALAELLATPRVVQRLAQLHRQVEGLVTEQVPIAPGSPYAERTLGDTEARSRTGASIVAVVRSGQVFASPTPDFVFEVADVVMVVGTDEGTAAVARILTEG